MELPLHLQNVETRVHRVLERWIARRPDAVALEDDSTALSYSALGTAVAETADRLARQGVRPGDRVLVVCENCVAAAVFFLAASKLDAWVSLVNARLTEREIEGFISLATPRLVAYLTGFSDGARIHGERNGASKADWPFIGPFLLGETDPATEAEEVFGERAEQVCALIFTSGTSGTPKAVMLTHENLLFAGANYRFLRDIRPEDRVYGVLPLSHVYGLTALLIATLSGGAALVLEPRFTPEKALSALGGKGITMIHGVPAMYAKLIESTRGLDPAKVAPKLRVAQVGGGPLGQSVKDGFENFFGVVLNNGYGITEASPSISHTRMDAPRKDTSVGVPVPGVEVRIADEEGWDAPEGGVGEIWVRGPTVMKGYYKDPALTADTVTQDGWLKTGDLGQRQTDGSLMVVGRSKDLIIRSGFNVYPSEVEGELNAHPKVLHSALVGRSTGNDEEIVAFVEPAEGETITAEEVLAHLKPRVSPYKMPQRVVVMAPLPVTGSGKIMKKALRDLLAESA